jgi:thiol-disulfide isomerase/thioredoxin
VALEGLKGQAVILAFWAPWCPSCRKLTPTLVELYNQNKDKGFTVVGYTRLYGTYRDELADKGKVREEEEVAYINAFLQRKGMLFPVGVATDKTDYEKYRIPAIPGLVFIDKKGQVNYTKIGHGNPQFVRDKVKKLLEE